MTKEELRKIVDEAEKAVYTPENFQKIYDDLNDSSKLPPSTPEGLGIRTNRILEKEILIEVLARVLAGK